MTAAGPTRVRACRVCGNDELAGVIDLGEQYLSSVFPDGPGYRDRIAPAPLDLVLCTERDGSCGLPQLGHRHDLTAMYADYPYASATNAAMRLALADVAASGRAAVELAGGDVVLDVGGNDGTLIGAFADDRVDLVVIDPAQGVDPVFDSERLARVNDFFSAAAYRSVADRPAKLAFSVAMFYHLDDPATFVEEVAQVLAQDGVWVVQMAYLPAMLATNMYDNIVHEHAGYYSVATMQRVLAQAGLEVFDVTFNDLYGGSFRLFAGHRGRRAATERMAAALAAEDAQGLRGPEPYRSFQRRIEQTREELVAQCQRIVERGESVWAYGASTKGNTILQFCGIGADQLVAAADVSPVKLGKLMIGSDVPIRHEDEMRAERPDWLLALPYSFVDAFVEREAGLVARGTRFLVPLPDVHSVP